MFIYRCSFTFHIRTEQFFSFFRSLSPLLIFQFIFRAITFLIYPPFDFISFHAHSNKTGNHNIIRFYTLYPTMYITINLKQWCKNSKTQQKQKRYSNNHKKVQKKKIIAEIQRDFPNQLKFHTEKSVQASFGTIQKLHTAQSTLRCARKSEGKKTFRLVCVHHSSGMERFGGHRYTQFFAYTLLLLVCRLLLLLFATLLMAPFSTHHTARRSPCYCFGFSQFFFVRLPTSIHLCIALNHFLRHFFYVLFKRRKNNERKLKLCCGQCTLLRHRIERSKDGKN